jgi:hypothetical protein
MKIKGVSEQAVEEIFLNPGDLGFSIMKDPNREKFGFLVTRGPGINFKHLIRNEDAGFQTVNEAADEIGRVLTKIVEESTQESGLTLTKANVQNIVTALKANQYYGTYPVY